MHFHLLFLRIALAGLVLIPALRLPAQAQDALSDEAVEERIQLFGEVVDRRTGEPIPIAAITLLPLGGQVSSEQPVWSGQSDEAGRFVTETIPIGAYRLNVRAVPFSRLTYTLILAEEGVVDVRVEMVGADYELEPIVASARRMTRLETEGFYEREKVGLGHFVDREDIEGRVATQVSDLFRSVPGARVIQGRGLSSAAIGLRGGCTPLFVLDGSLLSSPVSLDNLIDVNGLEGMEVYHAAAVPIQYSGLTTCGVVMLWSRDPISNSGRALTWKRALAAVGIGALIVLGGR